MREEVWVSRGPRLFESSDEMGIELNNRTNRHNPYPHTAARLSPYTSWDKYNDGPAEYRAKGQLLVNMRSTYFILIGLLGDLLTNAQRASLMPHLSIRQFKVFEGNSNVSPGIWNACQ